LDIAAARWRAAICNTRSADRQEPSGSLILQAQDTLQAIPNQQGQD
jgi:hypothetical protein